MKRIGVIVLCLFVLLGFAASAQAAVIGSDWQYLTAETRGKWKYFDINSFRSPIKGELHEIWLEVPLLPMNPQENTMLFATSGQAVEVFVEGSKVYADGDFSARFLGHGNKWHMVELPVITHETMLLFHLYADYPHQLGVFNNFIIDTNEAQARRIFAADFAYVLTLPVAVLLGMITLMYLLHRSARRRMNVKLLILMLLLIVWTISLSNVKQLVWDMPVVWRFLENFLCYLLPVSANAIIVEILEEDLRMAVQRTIWVYAALAAGALGAELLGYDGLVLAKQLLYAALLFMQAIVFRSMWESIRRGNVYSKFAIFPMVIMAVLGFLDGVLLYTRFWQWHIYLLPLGIYACIAFVICMIREQLLHEQELAAHAEDLMTEIAEAMARAELDELTGLRNRGAFEDFMRQKIETARNFSLIMLDIDLFKEINDTYGHDAGDRVLKQFSELVGTMLGDDHDFFRWGGEEFVIYCHASAVTEAAALAERIRQQVAAYKFFPHRQVTFSAGVAQWHHENDSQVGIFRRMDDALYKAKCNGRNQISLE